MQKKVELILNELIKNYIKLQEPISSTTLKEIANINLSPSTIRGYFQTLEKMGMIEKEHFASGSYPSIKAMEFFWKKNLPNKISNISLDTLRNECKNIDICAIVKIFENQVLNEVYNVNNKFIVLEFENDETVIRYDKNIFNLLKSLKFLDSKELLKILKHYYLKDLVKKIKNFQKNYIINQNLLYNKFNELNLEVLKQIDSLYINKYKKFLIKKYTLFDDKKEMEIYFIGDIYSNFLDFFESMKGGENGKTS